MMDIVVVAFVIILVFVNLQKGMKNVKNQERGGDASPFSGRAAAGGRTAPQGRKEPQKQPNLYGAGKPMAGMKPKNRSARTAGNKTDGSGRQTANPSASDREFTFGDNNAPSAERLYEGETPPPGKDVLICPYCGAGNLISQGQRGRAYSCYFCREIL